MIERLSARTAATEERLGRVFGALADPTRRKILARLREGEATVGAIAEPFPMTFAAVSKHVRVLEQAGLLRRVVRGRQHIISLDAAPLHEATAWTLEYRDFWDRRLDALESVLRRKRGRKRKGQR